MTTFATSEIRDWTHLETHARAGWVYRGQAESTWTLKTSLERACARFAFPLSKAADVRAFVFREFRRCFHHYAVGEPIPRDQVEWFSLMQHHGAPTHLLDFTYSLYVATYFAVEDGRDQSAVWAINSEWALEQGIISAGLTGVKGETVRAPVTEDNSEKIASILWGAVGRPFVLPATEFRLNRRLAVQRGTFLWCGDVSEPFDSNLTAMAGHEDSANVLKLVIPRKVGEELLRCLWRANVTRTTLFPGLDGFAGTLRVSMLAARFGGEWTDWSV